MKVLDFGIAKVTTLGEADAQAAALTRTDAMVGTPYYMAPEQVYGEKDIDARSDLWSMGIVLYECLAGVRPTEAQNLGQIFKLVTIGPIAPLSETAPTVPLALQKIVWWCLERAREARPQSARELRDALERVQAGSTMDGAEVLAHSGVAIPAARRRRWAPRLAGALAIALAGGTTAALVAKSTHGSAPVAVAVAEPSAATPFPPPAAAPSPALTPHASAAEPALTLATASAAEPALTLATASAADAGAPAAKKPLRGKAARRGGPRRPSSRRPARRRQDRRHTTVLR